MTPVASLATFISQNNLIMRIWGSRKLICDWSIDYWYWLFQIKGILVPWLCLQWGCIFPHKYSDSPDSWQFWHTGQDTCARVPSGGGGVYTMRRAAPWRHGMWRRGECWGLEFQIFDIITVINTQYSEKAPSPCLKHTLGNILPNGHLN